MLEKLEQLKKQVHEKIQNLQGIKQLLDLKVEVLSKKGTFSSFMEELKKVPNEQKPTLGQKINEAKMYITSLIEEKKNLLEQEELKAKLEAEKIDVTLPGYQYKTGSKHPMNIVIDEIINIFLPLGYHVEEGPELEKDYYNFEALNVPKNHPARDMQDTFFVTEDVVLRTQTSNMQVHALEEMSLPLKVACPGRVYRNDSDSAHSPIFNQFEAIVVDENVGMKDLMLMIKKLLVKLYGEDVKMRVRPSYFPFTEPSIEIDGTCQICHGKGCTLCKGTGFMEVFCAGVVNPKVLEMSGIDSKKYSGFAFGVGVDRSVMLTNKIPSIKYYFRNDMRFLKQMR